ncbi:MAG: GNAT family N-acetyltransferase [Candidatus Hodarchaeota archaeon]
MVQESITIRSYEKGDEEAQAEIFNTVIVEMIPEPELITAEKVRKRHEDPKFNPKQVLYLINQDQKIVGYTECRISGGFHGIFYPMILKEYRSKETLDRLFKAIYEFAKEDCKKNPGTIESHYAFDFKKAHEYFKSQTIAKVKEIQEAREIRLPINEINYEISSEYEIKPLTRNDFSTLVEYRKSKESIVGDEVTVENLTERFDNGEMSSEDSFLVYWKGDLAGYLHVETNSPADRGQKDTTVYGNFAGMIVDREFPDGVSLRKAMIQGAKDYFTKQNAKEMIGSIELNNPALEFYKKLGFSISEDQGAKYWIYEQ